MKQHLKKYIRPLVYIVLAVVAVIIEYKIPEWCLPATMMKDAENVIDIASLRVSVYSLTASIFIAFLIFDLENIRADRQKRDRIHIANKLMLASIEDGISWLISTPEFRTSGPATSIKEEYSEYRTEYAESLSIKSYILLGQTVDVIDGFINGNTEHVDYQIIWRIFPIWIDDIRNSPFLEYMSGVLNEHDLLTNDMVLLLNELGANIKDHVDINKPEACVQGNDNYILLERHNKRIVVRGNADHIVANGILAENKEWDGTVYEPQYVIENGYSETSDYIGNIENGQYSGKGKTLNEDGETIKEGLWDKGKLYKGIIHNCIIQIPKYYTSAAYIDATTGKSFIFWDIYDELFDADQIYRIFDENKDSLDEYYVTDLNLEEGKYSINGKLTSLKEFLKENDPDLLESLINEIN